jgi:hypothetical protein
MEVGAFNPVPAAMLLQAGELLIYPEQKPQ